jgi:hypothetical protein
MGNVVRVAMIVMLSAFSMLANLFSVLAGPHPRSLSLAHSRSLGPPALYSVA